MTPEQIRLVQESATVLMPRSDSWSTAFYDELFRTNPEVRPLFPEDLTLLRAKFTDEIASLLELIGDLTEFEERASRLGANHAGYGVRAAHYRASSTALIAAIDQALGDESTAEVLAAWRAVHDLVAETMMSGGQRAPSD